MVEPVKRYRLRWRFDYANGATKRGMWHLPQGNPEGQAAIAYNTSVIRAFIEGEDCETFEVVVMAECDGHDLVSLKWMKLVAGDWGGTFNRQAVEAIAMITTSGTGIIDTRGEHKFIKEVRSEDDYDNAFHSYKTLGVN